MKQRIEASQLRELSDGQKQKLREWWQPQDGDMVIISESLGTGSVGFVYRVSKHGFAIQGNDIFSAMQEKSNCLPVLSIGQMIEFLESKKPTLHIDKHLKQGMQKEDRYDVFQQGAGSSRRGTLCDALWDAVKKVLS